MQVEISPLDQLDEVACALQREDLTGLPGEALGDDLIDLRRQIERLEAEFLRRLRHFDRTQAYSATGALSAASWLRWKCKLAGSTAADRVRIARRLEELPQTTRAFAEGEINLQQVAVITRTVEEVGAEMAKDAEPILLEAAEKLDAGQLRLVTGHLRHCLDPDGSLEQHKHNQERRRLHISQTWDGLFAFDGLFDPEGGAMLQTALNALMPPPAADDQRTPAQRRADALVELAERQLSRGDLPQVGGRKPHLSVMVGLDTLLQKPGVDGGELEWARGSVLPSETLRRLACDCALTPIIVDSDGRTVGVGSTKRLFSGPKRRALHNRDRFCRFPGCDRPADWSDGHHIKHWLDGGSDDLENGLLLCRRHHVMVHEGGWALLRQDDGSIVAVPPGSAPGRRLAARSP
jgi:hypothetical protein